MYSGTYREYLTDDSGSDDDADTVESDVESSRAVASVGKLPVSLGGADAGPTAATYGSFALSMERPGVGVGSGASSTHSVSASAGALVSQTLHALMPGSGPHAARRCIVHQVR